MSPTPEPLPKRSANIFINYRREDSAGHTGRLFDHLSGRFPGRVFMDLDTIEPGIDFVEVITQAVGCCEVLIVMIGDKWLHSTDADGRRRLDNPSDFVRLEIAAALERAIRVIPVLVKDAAMPRQEDLPPDLAKLTRRNAIELSDARFAFDMDRLIQAIGGVLQEKAPSALLPAVTVPLPPPPPGKRARRRAAMALSVAGLLALAGGLGWRLGGRPGLGSSGRVSFSPGSLPAAPPTSGPPPVSPAVDRAAQEPAGTVRIVTARPVTARPAKTVRPPEEAPPRNDGSKARRWWDSAKQKVGAVLAKASGTKRR